MNMKILFFLLLLQLCFSDTTNEKQVQNSEASNKNDQVDIKSKNENPQNNETANINQQVDPKQDDKKDQNAEKNNQNSQSDIKQNETNAGKIENDNQEVKQNVVSENAQDNKEEFSQKNIVGNHKSIQFDQESFNQKIQEEMKQLENARIIMRKMERESHEAELQVLQIFKELLTSKVAVVSNNKPGKAKALFEQNRITSISKYKNLRCPLFKEENYETQLYSQQNPKKVQNQQQQDSLYLQLEKMSQGNDHLINKIDKEHIMNQLHNAYENQDLKDLEQIDLFNLPLTPEELLAQTLVKKQRKNQMSSISLSSTTDSNQEKDNDELSEEENQQGKMEIQPENKVNLKQFINEDKSKLSEQRNWDPMEQTAGFQQFFDSKDEMNQYISSKQLNKFELEKHLENEAEYLKDLQVSPYDIQYPKSNNLDQQKKLYQSQNKNILDLDLNEFMELSQHTIRKIYEEEKMKKKIEKLDQNQKTDQNDLNQHNHNARIENKSFEDFMAKNENDIEQAAKEQNLQNQGKKMYGTKYVDLINKAFFPHKNQKDKQKCDVGFKHQFIRKPKVVNKNPFIVKQDIKSFCPSIMKSCCSVKDLEYFFNRASQSLEKPIDELSNMKLFFKFIRTTPLKTWKQFIIKNYTKVRKCLPQNPAILMKALQFMQSNYSKIMKTYVLILKNATENVYSFYCSTCNLYSQKDFVYDNRKYQININQKEIVNFLQIHQKSFLMHSVYAMSNFFECFQFNMHFNEQEVMSFILPNSYLNFSATQNNPIYAFYESDSFRQYFDDNYFLYSKKFVLWGNLLKLVQETLNGHKYSNRLHVYKQEQLIQPFSNQYTKFNHSNIQMKVSKGNRGNIMQFNKVNSNNIYFKQQNDILLNMLEQTARMKFSSIFQILVVAFLVVFN